MWVLSEITQARNDDPMYMRYLEGSDSYRQKVEQRLPAAESSGMGSHCPVGTKFLLGMMKKFWRGW